MPLSDKEFALKILEFAESCILESAIQQVLLSKHVPNWRDEYQAILAHSDEVRQMIHQKVDPMRDRVFEAPDLSTVVEQLLRDVPRNDPR
jgi:hypothetical protein